MRRIRKLLYASLLLAPLTSGCVSNSTSSTATAVTAVKPETATIQYWLDKPVTTRVQASDYDQLWNACDRVSHRYLFAIDRTDYRDGVLTTRPLISKYFTEFWRHDVTFSEDLAQSSVATYRRTIRYELQRVSDDRYEVAVKVIVERSSSFERRVTTAIQYRDAFAAFPPNTDFYADDGTKQPQQNWYAVGRDSAMEAVLGDSIRSAIQ